MKWIESIVGLLAFAAVVFVFHSDKTDAEYWYYIHDRVIYLYCFVMTSLWCLTSYRIAYKDRSFANKVQLYLSGVFSFATAWNLKDILIGDPYSTSQSEIVFGIILLVIFLTLINAAYSRHT